MANQPLTVPVTDVIPTLVSPDSGGRANSVDLARAREEFNWLKGQNQSRNQEYFLLRQAVQGNFRWPRTWPQHMERLTRNMVRPMSARLVSYLLSKGFTWDLDRPNSLEYRESAERAEKILRRLFILSRSELQVLMGGMTGSQLGRTIFKVYKKGNKGAQYAAFSYCQPDYFYGIPSSDDSMGDYETVYYSYPMDIDAVRRLYGNKDYKPEGVVNQAGIYDVRPDAPDQFSRERNRRIPVTEVWTKTAYALEAGGVIIYNGKNPRVSKETGEGFVPFVVIENSRNAGEGMGEADIKEARVLNEYYNRLFSAKAHIVNRWLNPTVVWEGAPSNASEILQATVGGGGMIPARLGAKLSFMSYDKPNQAVLELENTVRAAILESAGLNELAYEGSLSGTMNTSAAVQGRFLSTLAAVEGKRMEWGFGLQALMGMLLEVQEQIGDSTALGQAVVCQDVKSRHLVSGKLVTLSGKDIAGLRHVMIDWPNILPKDDEQLARFEMEKTQAGLQSVYTFLEKTGVEYPDDEIARIQMENTNPALRGEKVAEQVRAQTPLIKANMQQQQAQQQMQMQQAQQQNDLLAQAAQQDQQNQPSDEQLAAQGDVGARIRQMAKAHVARLDMSGSEPVIQTGR